MTVISSTGLVTRRTLRTDLALILSLGLVANSLAASFVTRPGYPDAYYYFNGAWQLARGEGLVDPYLWNYLGPGLLQHAADQRWPSHMYWMPLTSMIAAPFVALAGVSVPAPADNPILFRAAQAPLLVLASLLPLLAYVVAWHLTRRRRHALMAAALTLFSPFYFIYWPNTDAFAVHGLAAASALAAATRTAGSARSRAWAGLAGLAAGLAHLARADGLLVLLVVILWVILTLRPRRAALPVLLLVLAAYALVMLPWSLRNWLVAGGGVAGGVQTVWLTDYNEIFNYATPVTVQHYLAQGLPAILQAKWAALLTNLTTLSVVQGGLVTFPFTLVGLWRLRRKALVQIAVLYELALLAAMTLVFTLPGVRGGFFHSGAALLPFFCGVAGCGLDGVVESAARRLPHWQPQKATPIFSLLLCSGAAVLTFGLFWARVIGPDWRQPVWSRADGLYPSAKAWLADNAAVSPVLAVNDPPGWYYFTGWPSIVVPNGGVPELLHAMDDFQAKWLLLDANYPAGLSGLYQAPASEPGLALRARFQDGSGRGAYLLERVTLP